MCCKCRSQKQPNTSNSLQPKSKGDYWLSCLSSFPGVTRVSPQAKTTGWVEGRSIQERVRRDCRNLRPGLCQRSQQSRGRNLGGAAPLQARVCQKYWRLSTETVQNKDFPKMKPAFLKNNPLIVSNSIPLCALINQHLCMLARKFPQTKFLKSISTTCIPNYPDHNLPTIFVYFEGDMKAQYIGPLVFGGMNLKADGK